jgi:ATP phosphoribosyltransferase
MITLGVPSKGRLMEKTFQWFAARGIEMRRTGSERDYGAEIAGLPVALRLLAAGEIPRELAAGRIHLGVTGSDLVQERIPAWDQAVETVERMGFGHADLVIAVPAWWVDVTSLEDLDSVAADFRATHGHRLRIATKYHRLVRDFLREKGVADYRLIDSQGATEGTVAHGTAEAIADITSTGETLRANHLAILQDGMIHRSEATLFRSRIAPWGQDERASLAAVTELLQAGPTR